MQSETDQTPAIGVKAFLGILNETLGFAFPSVVLEGEVSEWKVWKNLVFFKVKEDDSAMECFMPTARVKIPVEDGMKVRITGSPRFSTKGRYSFNGQSIELAGEGSLKRAFELLKAKLTTEGLFDAGRKRSLPRFPQRIGVVSAVHSAAYADFTKILGQRWGGLDLVVADVQVQGAAAPDQIVAGIEHINQLADPVDVLVVIRGGGSLEDLQAFNTEAVARSVAASRAPVVVGVGHEVDVSLADYAADVRAATPSNAAQLVVPDRLQIRQLVSHRRDSLEQRLVRRLDSQRQQIASHMVRLERFVRVPRATTERLQQRLVSAQELVLTAERHRLEVMRRLLTSYDPAATLKRGYAIVRGVDGAVVTDPKDAKPQQPLMLQLAKGDISVTVTDQA